MVAVRIRPMQSKEQKRGEINVLQAINKNVVIMKNPRNREIDFLREDNRSPSPMKSQQRAGRYQSAAPKRIP